MHERGWDLVDFSVGDLGKEALGLKKSKKLKLLADANIPNEVINELVAANINILELGDKDKNKPDNQVLELAHKQKRVLLTLDKDFWDENKTPIHKVKSGVIYIASSRTNKIYPIIDSFVFVYQAFARAFPGDCWQALKVKATINFFSLKMRNAHGKNRNMGV